MERRKSHGVRDSVVILVLALAAFAVGLGLFNGVVMPRLIHGTGEVQVPDLANLTVDQAERALRSTGLVLSQAGERFDPGAPRGFILSQDPPQGTPVRGHTRVSVTVSLGEEFSSVPELFGESRRSAQLLRGRIASPRLASPCVAAYFTLCFVLRYTANCAKLPENRREKNEREKK